MTEKLSDQFEQMFMQGHPGKWAISAEVESIEFTGSLGEWVVTKYYANVVIPGFHRRLKGLEASTQTLLEALRKAKEKHKKARKQVNYLAGQVRELKEKLRHPEFPEPDLVNRMRSRIRELEEECEYRNQQREFNGQQAYMWREKGQEEIKRVKELEEKPAACKIDGFEDFAAFEEHARKATAIKVGGVAWARMDQLNLTAAHRDKLLAEHGDGVTVLARRLDQVTNEYALYRRSMELERKELGARVEALQRSQSEQVKELREHNRALLKQRNALLVIVGERGDDDGEI